MRESESQARVLDRARLSWFRRRLRAWGRENFRHFPWRQTRDPYAILLAEVLLQQTFARKVVPVYSAVLNRYPSAVALVAADEDELRALILPLGLQSRARTLIDLAKALIERHHGEVPSNESELLSLPGVGPYTAGAVRSFAFGQRAAIPDANIVRVMRRFFGLGSPVASPPSSVATGMRTAALQIVPSAEPGAFNYAVLDFAAICCTHYRPACESCPLESRCDTKEFFVAQRMSRNEPVTLTSRSRAR
jgi:A/G-specific adenine glycosylase